jgi:hypothetical protein
MVSVERPSRDTIPFKGTEKLYIEKHGKVCGSDLGSNQLNIFQEMETTYTVFNPNLHCFIAITKAAASG